MEVLDGLRASLGAPVELRETHMSWVLLSGDRAYKLKKPVHFAFLDLSTPEARRRACEEEVEVNRALAADVVLGVRAVIPCDGGYALAGAGAEDAVDWVVEMRRFDEDATMAAAVERGVLRPEDVQATARTIERFHAVAARPDAPDWARDVTGTWRVNLDELADAAAGQLGPTRIDGARRFADAFLRRRGAELDARARDGCVVDGHGDLRAEHVLLGDEPVTIVDRLEFDAGLRRVDVADDLAFLVMDLYALGAGWAARVLVDAYRDAGADAGDDALVAAFAVYRAQVRAKVGFLRAAQLRGDAAGQARDAALRRIEVAERLAWTARGPLLLVVAGPPASGKSTVAATLARAGDLQSLSSDVLRKEELAVATGDRAPQGAYTAEARTRVYGLLGERAGRGLRAGSVVVDATFGDAAQRDAFLAALAPEDRERLRIVLCDAPLQVRVERARTRADAGGDPSDAGPEVVARLPSETLAPPGPRLTVDTTRPVPDVPARVAAWLDGAP